MTGCHLSYNTDVCPPCPQGREQIAHALVCAFRPRDPSGGVAATVARALPPHGEIYQGHRAQQQTQEAPQEAPEDCVTIEDFRRHRIYHTVLACDDPFSAAKRDASSFYRRAGNLAEGLVNDTELGSLKGNIRNCTTDTPQQQQQQQQQGGGGWGGDDDGDVVAGGGLGSSRSTKGTIIGKIGRPDAYTTSHVSKLDPVKTWVEDTEGTLQLLAREEAKLRAQLRVFVEKSAKLQAVGGMGFADYNVNVARRMQRLEGAVIGVVGEYLRRDIRSFHTVMIIVRPPPALQDASSTSTPAHAPPPNPNPHRFMGRDMVMCGSGRVCASVSLPVSAGMLACACTRRVNFFFVMGSDRSLTCEKSWQMIISKKKSRTTCWFEIT